MPAIGIDTHKRTLAACAVDDVGRVLDERTFSCDRAGFVELAAWATGLASDVRIGIEGSPHTVRQLPTTSSPRGSSCARSRRT
jgi:transposase